MARRLWRFSFGPLSSTKTMREVEESLLSGHAGEDRISDHMGDAPRVGGFGCILFACDLLAGRDVPQTILGRHMARVRTQQPAGQNELRVGCLPSVEVGPNVRIADRLGKACGVHGQKKNRTGEIVGDDASDLVGALLVYERGDGDGHGFEIRPGMNIDVACLGGRRGQAEGCRRQRHRREDGDAKNKKNKIHRGLSRAKNDPSPFGIIERRLAD